MSSKRERDFLIKEVHWIEVKDKIREFCQTIGIGENLSKGRHFHKREPVRWEEILFYTLHYSFDYCLLSCKKKSLPKG